MKNSTPLLKLIFTSLLTFLFSVSLNAQTKVTVNVLSMSFSPSNITINLGDTVEWNNNNTGNHNVNGTTVTFPSNPESFGNSLGTNWTYSHKFNTAGSYNYRCDVHFGSGMTGSITVLPASNVEEISVNEISVYPNPANNSITIGNKNKSETLFYKIFSLNGKLITNGIYSNSIDVSEIERGSYLLVLQPENSGEIIKRIDLF